LAIKNSLFTDLDSAAALLDFDIALLAHQLPALEAVAPVPIKVYREI